MSNKNVAKSMSLRARINNFAKSHDISPQLALQHYFSERFLARVERSRYMRNLAVKGGTLMSAILGVAQRTTMDIDATIVGMRADEGIVERLVREVAAIDLDDGIVFEVDQSRPGIIRKDDDYGGFSIGMIAVLGTIRLPIGIDITFGDIITPAPCERMFSPMLDENTGITVLAYTIETLIAEKLQTILKRGVANTRPRDYYDLYMLESSGQYDRVVLRQALANTVKNRHSEQYLAQWKMIVGSLLGSEFQKDQWQRYCNRLTYVGKLGFDVVVQSIERLLEGVGD